MLHFQFYTSDKLPLLKLSPGQMPASSNCSSTFYPLQETTAIWSNCFYALVHPVHV